MYQVLSESKITYISIGHRHNLKKYHQRLLKIEQKGVFKIEDIEDYQPLKLEKTWESINSSKIQSSPELLLQKDDPEILEDGIIFFNYFF